MLACLSLETHDRAYTYIYVCHQFSMSACVYRHSQRLALYVQQEDYTFQLRTTVTFIKGHTAAKFYIEQNSINRKVLV